MWAAFSADDREVARSETREFASVFGVGAAPAGSVAVRTESCPIRFGNESGQKKRVRSDRPFGDGPVQKGFCAMLWRHLCLVRAGMAAGLVSGLMFIGASAATAQTKPPVAVRTPSPRPGRSECRPRQSIACRPARPATSPWSLAATARNAFHLSIRNRSTRRLNVIVPPGLVAASSVGQGGGGGGGRGGMQSMGLGSAANREGAFGDFQGTGGPAGLRSIGASDEPRSREVAVPIGETIELTHPRGLPQLWLADPHRTR